MMEALLLLTLALAPALERSQQCKSNCAEENRSSAQRPSDFVIGLGGRVNDLRAHERQPDRAAHHHEADNRRMHAVDSTPLQDDADAMPPALVSRVPPTCVFSSPVTSCSPDGKHDRRQMPKGRIALLSFTPGRPDANEPASADAHSTPSPQVDQVGTMGRYVPEPAGMLGAASLRPVQVEDAGPSQREERAVHGLLAANAFFSVGSRLFTQRCLGEQTCVERNKLTRELYTNRPRTGIMVQAASTAIENYLLWRIHDNADKRAWVRAAIVGVLAFNVWNFANDLRVYKQTGRNR